MFNNKFNGPNSLTAQGQGANAWNRAMHTAESYLPGGVDDYDLAALADAEADGALPGTGAEVIASEPVAAEASAMRETGSLEMAPSEFSKRFGSVLADFGKDLSSNASTLPPKAPAFKATFRPVQAQSFGQQAMSELGITTDLNLNPYGFR